MRNHIRSNVIGYVALFFALSSSALAANTGVQRGHRQRRGQDGGPGDGRGRPGRRSGPTPVNNTKLADDAVTSTEIPGDGSVTGADVARWRDCQRVDLANGDGRRPTRSRTGRSTAPQVLDDNQTRRRARRPRIWRPTRWPQAEIATDGRRGVRRLRQRLRSTPARSSTSRAHRHVRTSRVALRGGQRHGRARQPQRGRRRDEGRCRRRRAVRGRLRPQHRPVHGRGHDRASPARARRSRARSTSPTAPATPRRCSSTPTRAPGQRPTARSAWWWSARGGHERGAPRISRP